MGIIFNDSQFAASDFKRRLPRQRHDKALLPMFLVECRPGVAKDWDNGDKYRFEVLGTFVGWQGKTYESLAVVVPGWSVPAYRIQSSDNSYCICQDFSRKALPLG